MDLTRLDLAVDAIVIFIAIFVMIQLYKDSVYEISVEYRLDGLDYYEIKRERRRKFFRNLFSFGKSCN